MAGRRAKVIGAGVHVTAAAAILSLSRKLLEATNWTSLRRVDCPVCNKFGLDCSIALDMKKPRYQKKVVCRKLESGVLGQDLACGLYMCRG